MKKLISIIVKPFIWLYKLFDRAVIVPVSKFVYFLYNRINLNKGIIEKFLNRSNALVYLSLIFAIAMFFYVDNKATTLVENEAEVLEKQPITVIYNEEAFVVEGIPKTVDIILMGRRSELYLAKQLGNHKVTLDLSGYTVGSHKVSLKYNHSVETVKYKLDPSTFTIKISEKVSASKSLTYDVLNQDKLDPKLAIGSVTLDSDSVVVKSSDSILKRVATVKALVDVGNANLEKAGTFPIEAIPLVAYDDNGNIITNVEIVPAKINATVVVTSYSIEVPIKVITTGAATVGYAISDINSSVTKVALYGEQTALAGIAYIEALIDIKDLSDDKTYNVYLTKPNGVRFMSDTATTVTVSVQAEASTEITVTSITWENLDEKYSANAASLADTSVDVILKGVKSVLNNIDVNNIQAYVDLNGLGKGTHNVPVYIKGDDVRVTYISKVKTISIVIDNKKQ